MAEGGPLAKTSGQQMESTRDSFGLDAPAKDNFNKDNNKSGQAKASDAPQESSPASAGAAGAGGGSSANTRMSFPKDLKYPIDIGTTKQDVIKFDMLKYEPKQAQSGQIGFGQRSKTDSRIIGSCFLPIPAGIQDAPTVTFNDDSMNAIQAAAAEAAITLSLIHISEPTRRYAISYAVF